MVPLRFNLVIFGGLADAAEARVAAGDVGACLSGISQDVRDVCRNLSALEGDSSDLEGRLDDCQIYIDGAPAKGQSIAFPLSAGGGEAAWGPKSLYVYVSGLNALRISDPGNAEIPHGFDVSILKRVQTYCQQLTRDHDGFNVDLPAINGCPAARATFDARLKTAIEFKLAAVEASRCQKPEDEPDWQVYGYSIQGVLYQLSDPEYQSSEGKITVEIDTHDGKRWVCHLEKSIAPPNLEKLWRTEVWVTGTASPKKKRKPSIEATKFRALPGLGEPISAMERLTALCEGAPNESIQSFMDRVRERA
jgi:hypothetical protein